MRDLGPTGTAQIMFPKLDTAELTFAPRFCPSEANEILTTSVQCWQALGPSLIARRCTRFRIVGFARKLLLPC